MTRCRLSHHANLEAQIERLRTALQAIYDLSRTMRERVHQEMGSPYLYGRADGSEDCGDIAREALSGK